MKPRLLLFMIFLLFILASCQSVKPYQRAYLNDRDFRFNILTVEEMEQKVHAYREGAAGAAKGKGSGGCGCR